MMNIQRIFISGGDNVKRMLITMAVLLAWPGAAFAEDLAVKVPADAYQQNILQLQEMKKHIAELEAKINQVGQVPQAAPAAQETQAAPAAMVAQPSPSKLKKMDRDISEIYDTLDEVETRALLDRINLGAEVRIRADNYQLKKYQPMYLDWNPMSPTANEWYGPAAFGMYPAAYIEDERNDSNWSSRFRINMEADVSKSVKFNARLALQKNWADSTGMFNHDNNRAHVNSGDTNLKVDRFYVDWTPKFFVPIGISFGRLPTSDGPPLENKENRERQSIYPALIFDGEPDGIVATLGLERYTGLKNSGVRYFYAMAAQYDADHTSMSSYLDGVTADMYKDNRVQATFFETEVPGMRDSLLVLSYVPAKDIMMFNPVTGEMANIGDITLWGAHLQFSDLFGLGLDIFGSYGENKNEPNGNTITMGGGTGAVVSGAPMMEMGMMDTYFHDTDGNPLNGFQYDPNLKNQGSTETTTGRAWYVGLRYEIPVSFLNRPKIGVEYNKGNQYWFSYTPGPSEIYNRLATRGEALDYYYIQPFNKNVFLRIGQTQITYEYMGSGMPLGDPMEYETNFGDKPKFYNSYVILDTRF